MLQSSPLLSWVVDPNESLGPPVLTVSKPQNAYILHFRKLLEEIAQFEENQFSASKSSGTVSCIFPFRKIIVNRI